ncbi:hypothetical protein [Embleya sp. NBC_00896]|uniref:hypothetical protein n=1 Tax=Embleya sp. NBC_00896 TaxID=2975961 RepID=UPI00386CB4F4|nr:hypothetical protein OG928_20260 [Embleya sp. NBC_00896]
MSVTVLPPGADDAEAVPEPPEFPYRPLPADLTRRVRRRAHLRRLRHLLGSFALAVGALGTLWLATPGHEAGGGLPPAPLDPTPMWPVDEGGPPTPRTDVGLGGSAWIGSSDPTHGSAWCLGAPNDAGKSTAVALCRFLPTPGRLDAAALNPGVYAPAGERLVVAVLIGQSPPGPAVRAELEDTAGPRQMRLDRPPGLPGVAYLWAFTTGGPVSITVYDGNGDIVTACAACTESTR